MNQKKAKAIRRFVRASGKVKSDFPLHHVNLTGSKLVPADHLAAGFGGIITARYPQGSFQRMYRQAKRIIGRNRFGLEQVNESTRALLAAGQV